MSFRSTAFGIAVLASACTSSNVSPYVSPAPTPLSVAVVSDPDVRADGTVPRNARFKVQLDDYPDPDTVGYGPITLNSGGSNFDIDVSIDFVKQQVVVTPHSLLAPGVQYELVVSGLVALDNRAQADGVAVPFQVGTDDGVPFPTPPRPTWNADIRGIIGTCAPQCHTTMGVSNPVRIPTRDLNLAGDPRDPVFGLINVQSVGLRGTPTPLARVTPFDPARSVLLRKLLGGDPNADSQDPPYPNMRVDGRRMPINLDESPKDPLARGDIQTVQDWIAAGAPMD